MASQTRVGAFFFVLALVALACVSPVQAQRSFSHYSTLDFADGISLTLPNDWEIVYPGNDGMAQKNMNFPMQPRDVIGQARLLRAVAPWSWPRGSVSIATSPTIKGKREAMTAILSGPGLQRMQSMVTDDIERRSGQKLARPVQASSSAAYGPHPTLVLRHGVEERGGIVIEETIESVGPKNDYSITFSYYEADEAYWKQRLQPIKDSIKIKE